MGWDPSEQMTDMTVARSATCLIAILACTAAVSQPRDETVLRIATAQAPSILNPYLSGGAKDTIAASMVLEPLARHDADGTLVPWLAERIPSVENGGISADLTRITWRLKDGIVWSDDTPLTSADVAFTFDYCAAPGAGCAREGRFAGVQAVLTPDARTAEIVFEGPRSNPFGPFVSAESPILQKAQFEACLGEAAVSCTGQNFAPIGTGPFIVDELRPNDQLTLTANPAYRAPGQPGFSGVLLKGVNAPEEAARSVLSTGEFDFAWGLQVAPDVLTEMAAEGAGTVEVAYGGMVEQIFLNHRDPDPALPEARRSVEGPHPFLQEPAVHRAMSLAIDRDMIVELGYGAAAKPACSWVPSPAPFDFTDGQCPAQDIPGARDLLDAAGVVDTDGDGIREADGAPLEILYQTATSPVRQDIQALVKSWWEEIGFEVELRNIAPPVFFGGDPSSPDTVQKFYADVQQFAISPALPDPETYLSYGLCENAPGPESQWQGSNPSRFCDPRYDALHAQMTRTADSERRQEIGRELNRMAVETGAVIPLVHRGEVIARTRGLENVAPNAWDSPLWNIAEWRRAAP